MLVRARDDIYRMAELKGKKIGLTKSLNTIKNDWWRIQEEQGIELMLRVNGMTRDDVEIVEFPYPDDWYDNPAMLEPMENPSELWLKRDHKHDLAFRPLETALETGVVDAIYSQSKPFQHLQEATGKFKAIEDLSRYPDWTLQVANIPAVITCTDVMAEEHPELVVTFMKGMIKVGRWANEHKHAAAAILDKQTFYLDVEDTYRGIKDIDMVPNLSPQNLVSVEIGKDFMLSHGYIANDFDVHEWAAPEFLEQAARDLLEEEWAKRSHVAPARGHRTARRNHPARLGVDMAKTAAQMVAEANARIPTVTPQEAQQSLAAGGVVLLDVREPTEWETHIPGSVQIPRGILEAKADPTSPRHDPALDPGRQVIVYCRSGARAALAGVTLTELGFTDVVNLAGGITAWKEAGLPTADAHADI